MKGNGTNSEEWEWDGETSKRYTQLNYMVGSQSAKIKTGNSKVLSVDVCENGVGTDINRSQK